MKINSHILLPLLLFWFLLPIPEIYSQNANYYSDNSLINTLELAENVFKKGNYENTKKYIDEIKLYPKEYLNNEPELQIKIYILIADLDRVTGFLDTSFTYYQQALILAQENKLVKEEVLINIKLSEFFRGNDVFDKARYHISEAEKLIKETNFQNDSVLAYFYNRYAALPVSVDSSTFFSYKSNYHAEKCGSKEIIANNMNNLGMLTRYKGVDTAYKYFSEAVLIWRDLNMKQDLLNSLVNISFLFYDFGDYQKAIEHADILYKEINQFENTYAFEVYSKIKHLSYYQLGYIDSAYYYQTLMHECVVNRLFEEQKVKISNLETKIDLEKNIKLIEDQKNELKIANKIKNLFLTIAFFSIIFLLIFTFLLIKIFKEKKLVTKQKVELDALYKEVHHRVKNNLAIIVGILELQIDNASTSELKAALQNASSRINSMSLIHDLIHKNFSVSKISASEYIQHLINYIVNFQSNNRKIQTKLVCSDNLMINMQTAVPIGIVINELILNSIKHAKTKNNKIICDISLEQDEQELFLNYSDNGTKNETIVTSKSKGIGLYLIETMTKQLDGQMIINFENGFSSEFYFKIQH